MPLKKQSVNVSFDQGLDTKTDPKQVVQGKLLLLQNGIFVAPKKIEKRNGNQKLAQAGTQGSGCASYRNELIAFDGLNIRSFANSLSSFQSKGSFVSVEVANESILSNDYAQSSQDACYHPAGLKVYVWEDSRASGSRYSVFDVNTSQQIVSDVSLDTVAKTPKAFALGNYVVIVYFDTGASSLVYKYFAVNTPTTLSLKATITGSTSIVTANPYFDATVIGQRLFITWNDDTGAGAAGQVRTLYMTSNLTISAVVTITSTNTNFPLTIWGDINQNVWIAFWDATNIKGAVYDYNLNAVVTVYTIDGVANVLRLTATESQNTSTLDNVSTIFYEISATNNYDHFVRRATLHRNSTTVTVSQKTVFKRSVGLSTKAFSYGSTSTTVASTVITNFNVYVGMVYDSTLQPTYFFSSINDNLIAKVAFQVAGGLPAKVILPQVSVINSSNFFVALLEKSKLSVVSGAIYSTNGVIGATLAFSSDNIFLRAQMAQNLHVTGGFLWMYDGISMVEHGFHVFPEQAAAPSQATTTGFISPGTYSYSFVYAWTDNEGNIHRSAPSVPQQVVVPAGTSTNKVTWALPTLRLTHKQALFSRADCVIEVYRTQAAGTIYYKVTSTSSPTINDPTVDTVSFADTLADTTILGNELLYTTGGVLENIPPPAISLISTFKGRIVVVPSENKQTFWISKKWVPGSPVEFTDSFQKSIDAKDGDITAIAEMDEKEILFKANTAWLTGGNGPDDTGSQDDFINPEQITTANGCDNPRSVVVTPEGLMRHTPKGIYLLDRTLQDSYIGAPVEAFNNLNITAAVLVPNTNQVRFATDSGTTLVYDYFFNQWSVFTNQAAVDATAFQSLFTFLDANGNAFQETPGIFVDGTQSIRLKILTSWLSFAGLQGFQRIYQLLLLGDYKTAHRLIVTLGYDFNPNPTQQTYIDAGSLLQGTVYGSGSPYGTGSPYGGNDPLYQFRVFTQQQKCQAIQVGLEEVQDSNFGEGLSISALNFLVGIKSGTFKVPVTRSF